MVRSNSKKKSGTAIGTKFLPPYAHIFMDEVEAEFLKSQELQLFLWLQKLIQFLNELNNFHSNLKYI